MAGEGAERPPKAFISYAYDNPVHKDLVLSFWKFLRENGVDALIDQVEMQRRSDWARWVLEESEDGFVLVIASPEYQRAADGRTAEHERRGVQLEAALLLDEIVRHPRTARQRIIGVILPGYSKQDLPRLLVPNSNLAFPVTAITVAGAEDLLRFLLRRHRYEDIPVGLPPALPPQPIPNGRAGRWAALVREHPAWRLLTADGCQDARLAEEMLSALRTPLTEWETKLIERTARLAADPWWDIELAERVGSRASWLVEMVDRSTLTPAEAALIAVLPLLHELHWAVRLTDAAEALPTDPHLATEFGRFCQGFPRVVRRSSAARHPDELPRFDPADPASWWLLHRWLVQSADSYRSTVVAKSLGTPGWPADRAGALLGEVLSVPRVAAIIRAHRTNRIVPTQLTDLTGLRSRLTLLSGSPDESDLRELTVALLLMAAHRFAVEPAGLPAVIAEHLAIHDQVRLPDLLRTIRRLSWQKAGPVTRNLTAECDHQAVDLALREHVESLADFLGVVQSVADQHTDLGLLSGLPPRVVADGVVPAGTEDGPAYGVGFRFRLADDRIQELLMGEQLYGDRALAIRELYQNALDACRYRRSRLEFLTAGGHRRGRWRPSITLEQGTDEDGRRYIQCTDSGIGMGVAELVNLFSNAGTRFVELPEFVEEQAQWAEAGIGFAPNSRFGVGVLSYFMVADEIQVRTCRLGRDGSPGPELRVDIAGPGTLSRIRELSPVGDPGTSVRLYLRDDVDVSCIDLLARTLWVSEFDVEVRDGDTVVRWLPGVLSVLAPVGARDPFNRSARGTASIVVESAVPDVWWCDSAGGLLADGVWVGQSLYGAVVDLTGRLAPSLTVNRRRVLGFDEDAVRHLLRDAVPALLETGIGDDPVGWFVRLADENPELADEVARRIGAEHAGLWTVGPGKVPMHAIGVYPLDELIFGPQRGTPTSRTPPWVPEPVARWRLAAWASAGALPGLKPSTATTPTPTAIATDQRLAVIDLIGQLPQDLLLRSANAPHDEEDRTLEWTPDGQPVKPQWIARASALVRRPPTEIADFLAELGYSVVEHTWPARILEPADADLLRDITVPTPPSVVFAAAERLEIPLAQAAARMSEMGFDLPSGGWPDRVVSAGDHSLLSVRLDGDHPFLDPAVPVAIAHVNAAAVVEERTPEQVARRLVQLGYRVARPELEPARWTAEDRVLLSVDRDGAKPVLSPIDVVPLAAVLRAAKEVNRPPSWVAQRMTELGLTVGAAAWPTLDESMADLTEEDFALLTPPLDDVGQPLVLPWPYVGRAWVAVIAVAAGLSPAGPSPAVVGERLGRLGAAVEPADWAALGWEDADRQLLCERPYLEPGRSCVLNPGVPLTPAQVFLASARSELPPDHAAARLAALGFGVPALPDVTWGPDVRRLLSHGLDSAGPWLSAADPVPVDHPVRASLDGGTPVDHATTLADLGFTVTRTSWPAWTDTDRELVRQIVQGSAPVEDFGFDSYLVANDVPPTFHRKVLTAAVEGRLQPAEVVARLESFGVQVEPFDWAALGWTADDVLLVREAGDDPGDLTIAFRALLAVAVRLGRAPVEIADRAEKLGLTIEPGDRRLVNRMVRAPDAPDDDLLMGGASVASPVWGDLDPVPGHHIADCAARLHRPAATVAQRIMDLGLRVTNTDWSNWTAEDARLVRLSQHDQSLPRTPALSLQTILRTAARARADLSGVADRLSGLGFAVPKLDWSKVGPVLPEDAIVEIADEILLSGDGSMDLFAETILRAAASYGRSAQDVAVGLRSLGFHIEATFEPKRPDPGLNGLADVAGGILTVRRCSSSEVLETAWRTSLPPSRIARAAREAGIAVPDVAWPSVVLADTDRRLLMFGDGPDDWVDLATTEADLPYVLARAYDRQVRPSEIVRRLRGLGMKVVNAPWDDLPVPPHELEPEYLSLGATGEAPWLNPSEEVPLLHVAVTAAVRGVSPEAVVVSLRDLGFTVSDHQWPAGGLDERDAELLLRRADLRVQRPPIPMTADLDGVEVLLSAAGQDMAINDVAQRLCDLGGRVTPDLSAVRKHVSPSDLGLIYLVGERDPEGGLYYEYLEESDTLTPLGMAMPVPRPCVVSAAIRRRVSEAAVAERLAALGYQLPDVDWPDQPEDLQGVLATVVSRDLDGIAPFLDPRQPIPAFHITRAAAKLDLTPAEVRRALVSRGYSTNDDVFREHRYAAVDALLLDWLPENGLYGSESNEADVGIVLSAASDTGLTTAEVVARCEALGIAVPPLNWTASGLVAEDVRMVNEQGLDDQQWLNGGWRLDGPWLDPSEPVSVARVFVAAATSGTSPARSATRLAELGYEVPARDWPANLTSSDRQLLSLHADGRLPCLDPHAYVPAEHVLATAARLLITPEAAARRLREMDFKVEVQCWPDVALTLNDLILISRDLDSRHPWLPWASLAPVSARHILAAAIVVGIPHAQVVARLLELGYPVDCVRLSEETAHPEAATREPRIRSATGKPGHGSPAN